VAPFLWTTVYVPYTLHWRLTVFSVLCAVCVLFVVIPHRSPASLCDICRLSYSMIILQSEAFFVLWVAHTAFKPAAKLAVCNMHGFIAVKTNSWTGEEIHTIIETKHSFAIQFSVWNYGHFKSLAFTVNFSIYSGYVCLKLNFDCNSDAANLITASYVVVHT